MSRLLLLLPLALCPLGCMTWWSGTIPPGKLEPQLQASHPQKLQLMELASLGRPVQDQTRIQTGDLLDVTVSDLMGENQALPLPARVQEDGTIRLPLIGAVPVSHLTVPETERAVFASYCSQGVLRRPQVMVSLRQTQQVRITVLGAVNKPGQYELNTQDNDLLSALVVAGGLNPEAGSTIEIHRRSMNQPVPLPGEQAPEIPLKLVDNVPAPGKLDLVQPPSSLGNEKPRAAHDSSEQLPSPLGGEVKGNTKKGAFSFFQSGCGILSKGCRSPEPKAPSTAKARIMPPLTYVPPLEGWKEGGEEVRQIPAFEEGKSLGFTNGGPARDGSPVHSSKEIQQVVHEAPLRLGEPQVISLDVNRDKDRLLISQGIRLQNGDTVHVEERKIKPIYVVGMVNKPGDFPFPRGRELRVLEAVGLAGGVDRVSLPSKVVVVRQRPDESGLVAIRVDLDQAKRNMEENLLLMPGDTVSVEETFMSYARGLLRGALRLGVGASVTPAGIF